MSEPSAMAMKCAEKLWDGGLLQRDPELDEIAAIIDSEMEPLVKACERALSVITGQPSLKDLRDAEVQLRSAIALTKGTK